MTATNHALTGAIVGLSIHQPAIAVPVAFLSHYILDGIPHFDGVISQKSRAFKLYLLTEALICFGLVLWLKASKVEYWWLGALCAFVAASPDFMWIKGYIAVQRGLKVPKPRNILVKLHDKVQWFARPIGGIVEIIWLLCAIWILALIAK